ncbi:MAG: hypothetical protein D8H91_01200 [Alloprevotella sp.]|nr:MAG: hypothetical protein D8H91_01200 [Alloprevotella sp.]
MNCRKYVAPAIEIITMQTEGMIAGSNNNGSGGLTIGSGDLVVGPGEGSMGAAEQTSFEVEEPTSFELKN